MTTVFGTVIDPSGNPTSGIAVQFSQPVPSAATTTALVFGSNIQQVYTNSSGFFSLNLIEGEWIVYVGSNTGPQVYHLEVPAGPGSYNIVDLLEPLPSGVASRFGYSRTEVDTLLAALVAGGAGAPTGTPTGTRLYFDRTARALYIGDNGSWTQLLAL